MKFDFEGSSYELEFQRVYKTVRVGYDQEKKEDIVAPSRFPYTTASLWRTKPGEVAEMVMSYTVGAHNSEKFTIEKGRLNALRMMTKGLKPKEYKRAIWEAYVKRPRTSGEPKVKE